MSQSLFSNFDRSPGEIFGLGVCAAELADTEGCPVRGRSGGRLRSIVGTTRRERAPERAEVGKPQDRYVLPRRLLGPVLIYPKSDEKHHDPNIQFQRRTRGATRRGARPGAG